MALVSSPKGTFSSDLKYGTYSVIGTKGGYIKATSQFSVKAKSNGARLMMSPKLPAHQALQFFFLRTSLVAIDRHARCGSWCRAHTRRFSGSSTILVVTTDMSSRLVLSPRKLPARQRCQLVVPMHLSDATVRRLFEMPRQWRTPSYPCAPGHASHFDGKKAFL